MQQQYRCGVRRALVQIMHSKAAAFGIVNLQVAGGEIVIFQIFETVIGGAQIVHGNLLCRRLG